MTLFEDQETVLKDCTGCFELLGIAYMLNGSMAMIEYAMMRMANGIDIVIEVTYADAERIIKAFEPDYFPHGRVRDAVSRKFMFDQLHQETPVKVDCVVKKDTEFQKQAFSRRHKVNFTGFDVWTISREDLILSKLLWAKKSRSEMQMRDVASIIRNGFDEKYTEEWAKKLDLEDILKECKEYLEQNYVDGHDA